MHFSQIQAELSEICSDTQTAILYFLNIAIEVCSCGNGKLVLTFRLGMGHHYMVLLVWPETSASFHGKISIVWIWMQIYSRVVAAKFEAWYSHDIPSLNQFSQSQDNLVNNNYTKQCYIVIISTNVLTSSSQILSRSFNLSVMSSEWRSTEQLKSCDWTDGVTCWLNSLYRWIRLAGFGRFNPTSSQSSKSCEITHCVYYKFLRNPCKTGEDSLMHQEHSVNKQRLQSSLLFILKKGYP